MAIAAKKKGVIGAEARLVLIDINLMHINGSRHLAHSEANKGKFSAIASLQVAVEERDEKPVVCIISTINVEGTTTKGRKKDIPVFDLEIQLEGVFEIREDSNIKTIDDVSDLDAYIANLQINPTLVAMVNQNIALMGYKNANVNYQIKSFRKAEDVEEA